MNLEEVTNLFNEMSDDYDEIRELWYAWLFSRLHYIIAKNVIDVYDPRTILDIGCGTGFQSFLHASAGSSVIGVDIADKLIEIAKEKSKSFTPQNGIQLFPAHFDFVKKYNRLIFSVLEKRVKQKQYIKPEFRVSDATDLPFDNQMFDHVNCCGSTISLIDDHVKTLKEIFRVLKPDGTFLIEVEARWNLELFWSLFDSIFGGKLEYENSIPESLALVFTSPSNYVYVDYPFSGTEKNVIMKIKLFTKSRLRNELRENGLEVLKIWNINSVTNFIPSTFLDKSNTSNMLKNTFNFFAKIEECVGSFPGSSIVFLGKKI